MIFRRTKHKLPKFPSAVASTFHSLCKAVAPEEIDKLRVEIAQCKVDLLTASKNGTIIKPELLEKLYQASLYLIDNYLGFSRKQRALAIGAIRYFAIINDPLPDNAFTSGLFDDIQVMNHVLEKLGGEEFIIKA